MKIFHKTDEFDKNAVMLIRNIDDILKNLEVHSNNIEISNLKNIKRNFILKINDFFRENRKLNIGVIGQVKAGKSTFLNTLIFDGKDVLPKASTPKTATLTKIEYSDVNSLEIEYYTENEWKELEENAKIDSDLNEYVVAREIMEMIRKTNLDPKRFLQKRGEIIRFSTEQELMGTLNDYTGEDGRYTPIVKSVKININNNQLREISIVDAPGLNDPVASRTDKTKQLMETCDVVFFLSRASAFLDKTDVDLLAAQLPQKGVKKLILVCSRYDDGLADTIMDQSSLNEANLDTRFKLKRQAVKIFDRVIEEAKERNTITPEFEHIIEDCKNPVFVSSITHNMSKKEVDQYNDEEKNVYDNLNIYNELSPEFLRQIGNFTEVRQLLGSSIEFKEDMLLARLSNFIPSAITELKVQLYSIKETLEKRVSVLSENEKEKLQKQKQSTISQINSVKADVENIFGELSLKIEKTKVEGLKNIRGASKMYSSMDEKSKIETLQGQNEISTSKWFKPWTWGTTRMEYYTYDERYYYLDVVDALENVRNFSRDSASTIEHTFEDYVDIGVLKTRLLNSIVKNFDTFNSNYDSAFFKLLTEKTLNNFELPHIKMDVSAFLERITSNFTGEIKDMNEKSELKILLSDIISQLFDELSERFVEETTRFKVMTDTIKNEFLGNLLDNINKEFNVILGQFENKEEEIMNNKNLIEIIDTSIKKIA